MKVENPDVILGLLEVVWEATEQAKLLLDNHTKTTFLADKSAQSIARASIADIGEGVKQLVHKDSRFRYHISDYPGMISSRNIFFPRIADTVPHNALGRFVGRGPHSSVGDKVSARSH